jgi:hypothetical protein
LFPHPEWPAAESLVYGSSVLVPVGNRVALRTELVGQHFDVPGSDVDALALEPGVDVWLPCGKADIVLRPSVSVGLNDDSSDWGVGGSVAAHFPLPGGGS